MVFPQFKQYDKIVIEKTDEINIDRIFYMCIGAVPINILHIVFFSLNESNKSGDNLLWKQKVIFAHVICAVISLSIAAITFRIRKAKLHSSILSSIVQTFFVCFFMALSITLATVDQLITNSITPFLIACIAISFFIFMRPTLSLLLYSIGFLIFFFSIDIYQHNLEVLLSNRVNGITFIGLSIIVSLVLWNNELKSIQQNILIEKQKNDLLIANDTKDTFFSIIGHDLRGPIGGIVGLSELLEDGDMLDASEKQMIYEKLSSLAKSTQNLLENLLKWAMLQKGQISIDLKPISITSIIKNEVSVLHTVAAKKNIQIINQIDTNIQIISDANFLSIIVRNFLSNAIKFTPEGGHIILNYTIKGSFINFSVTDNGVGLTEEQIASLYSRGNKISTRGTKGEKGTGLGLLLCKEFANILGGNVFVESKKEVGSTFVISIPFKEYISSKATY